MTKRLCILAAVVWVVGACGLGYAQTIQQQGLEPVDQMVEDIDPLLKSLRRRESGLSTVGEQGRVFRYIDPRSSASGEDRLVYIDQGFVAEFDRSQYGLVMNRRTRQPVVLTLIPPNTVFHLGLPRGGGASGDTPADAPYLPGQIDGRAEGGSLDGSAVPPGELSDFHRHQQTAVAQRAVVVRALERLADPD